jgi:GntR family transcriptional regulator
VIAQISQFKTGGDEVILIDIRSRTPIFEQIKEQIINLINIGELKPDDKLPSIRQLASDLDLNVNTVKRAFQELETERVTYSIPGKGIFVSPDAVANKIVQEGAEKELTRILTSSKAKGITLERVIELANEIYEKRDIND